MIVLKLWLTSRVQKNLTFFLVLRMLFRHSLHPFRSASFLFSFLVNIFYNSLPKFLVSFLNYMKRVIIVILKLVSYNFSCSDYDLLITVTIIIPLLDAEVKNLFIFIKYSVVKMLSCIIPSNLNGVLESSPPQMSFPCVMDDC